MITPQYGILNRIEGYLHVTLINKIHYIVKRDRQLVQALAFRLSIGDEIYQS